MHSPGEMKTVFASDLSAKSHISLVMFTTRLTQGLVRRMSSTLQQTPKSSPFLEASFENRSHYFWLESRAGMCCHQRTISFCHHIIPVEMISSNLSSCSFVVAPVKYVRVRLLLSCHSENERILSVSEDQNKLFLKSKEGPVLASVILMCTNLEAEKRVLWHILSSKRVGVYTEQPVLQASTAPASAVPAKRGYPKPNSPPPKKPIWQRGCSGLGPSWPPSSRYVRDLQQHCSKSSENHCHMKKQTNK